MKMLCICIILVLFGGTNGVILYEPIYQNADKTGYLHLHVICWIL